MGTGILSQIGTKLRDWAVWQTRAGCYSQAVLSSNDSKTLYSFAKVLSDYVEEIAGSWDMPCFGMFAELITLLVSQAGARSLQEVEGRVTLSSK